MRWPVAIFLSFVTQASAAATFVAGSSGITNIEINAGSQASVEARSNRLQYMHSLDRSPTKYGVYVQSASTNAIQGEVFDQAMQDFSVQALGIETAMWLPALPFVEASLGVSLQSAQVTQEAQSIHYTQGAAARLGFAIAPYLGPIALIAEASLEVGRFVNGTVKGESNQYLDPISYQSAGLLLGTRLRF